MQFDPACLNFGLPSPATCEMLLLFSRMNIKWPVEIKQNTIFQAEERKFLKVFKAFTASILKLIKEEVYLCHFFVSKPGLSYLQMCCRCDPTEELASENQGQEHYWNFSPSQIHLHLQFQSNHSYLFQSHIQQLKWGKRHYFTKEDLQYEKEIKCF